jgi:hypothetical protein
MALYFFTDAGGGRRLIADSNINFTGAWSGSHAYAPRDAAADGFGHNWLALVSNTGVALPSTFDTSIPTTWSHLVLKEPAPPSEQDEAYALAVAALTTAWTGTAAAAAAGSLAQVAYNTALVGTAAAAAAQAQANQANAVATDALTTAWAGTGAAAYALYQAGTLSGELALGYSGSHSTWTSSTGQSFDTQLFFTNGILTDIVPPP